MAQFERRIPRLYAPWKSLRLHRGMSGENIFHHEAVHIGKPEAAALLQIIQPLVIDAEEVKDSGLEITDVDRAGSEGAFVRVSGCSTLPSASAMLY